jgi:membrane fusion protein, multidrug efflux system
MRSYFPHRTLLAIAVGIAALFFTACDRTKAAPPPASALPVVAALAEQKDVPVQVRAIGGVEAYSTVAVKTQITGELTGVYFKEGDDVRRGQLLFTLDKRPLEAELRKQESTLARDQAQAANARAQQKRYQSLVTAGVVSSESYDQFATAASALDAAVEADKAAVENARVQLQYCSIYSPINGRTGNLIVHRGNMIKANDNPPLVNINQVQPIYVTFTIPEQYLGEIKQLSARGRLRVEAKVPNDPHGGAAGKLSFFDNAVDQGTGTIKLKGEFVNADRRLWPGQFVDAVLTLRTQPGAIVVPSQAIQNGQQGQYVFVIKKDMTVESRPVSVIQGVDGKVIVQKGLVAGEQVVTDGQLRLVPGARVTIKQATGAAVETVRTEGN